MGTRRGPAGARDVLRQADSGFPAAAARRHPDRMAPSCLHSRVLRGSRPSGECWIPACGNDPVWFSDHGRQASPSARVGPAARTGCLRPLGPRVTHGLIAANVQDLSVEKTAAVRPFLPRRARPRWPAGAIIDPVEGHARLQGSPCRIGQVPSRSLRVKARTECAVHRGATRMRGAEVIRNEKPRRFAGLDLVAMGGLEPPTPAL